MMRFLIQLFSLHQCLVVTWSLLSRAVQDDMASVSGRSVGVGSEVGELADMAADESLNTSGITTNRFIWSKIIAS